MSRHKLVLLFLVLSVWPHGRHIDELLNHTWNILSPCVTGGVLAICDRCEPVTNWAAVGRNFITSNIADTDTWTAGLTGTGYE